jgi:hypothetical protein
MRPGCEAAEAHNSVPYQEVTITSPGDPGPSRAQVEWVLSSVLRRIAKGAVSPRAGLRELVDAYHAAPQADSTRFVGDEYGIAQLVGYFYGYDDIEERPSEVTFDDRSGREAVTALDAEVVRLAREWLNARRA